MELRQLQYFLALSEELHFNRAAKRLHISQPPLSRQIRQLEEELGVDLLYRTTRKVELTDAGHTFANEARHILAQVVHASGLTVQANRGIAGQLVAGYTPARANIVARTVRAFAKRYPNVRVSLHDMLRQNMELIRDGRIDVGFVALPVNGAGLVIETILRERFVVAMAKNHPLARRKKISILEVAREPSLLFPRYLNPAGYDTIVGLCRKYGLPMNIVLEVENIHMRIELVRAGFGICVIRSSTAQSVRGENVVFRPLQNSPIVELGLAYNAENRSRALPLFTDTAKATAG
jgi:DNA-binding transcriptional LysR family regulator